MRMGHDHGKGLAINVKMWVVGPCIMSRSLITDRISVRGNAVASVRLFLPTISSEQTDR